MSTDLPDDRTYDTPVETYNVLSRHYSSIGIADVFLSNPPHPFPWSYLKQGLGDSSGFLSWEIIATIKFKPEDFVVREIGLAGRSIPGLSDAEVESIRVADIPAESGNQVKRDSLSEKKFATTSLLEKQESVESANNDKVKLNPMDALRSALESCQEEVDDVLAKLQVMEKNATEHIKGVYLSGTSDGVKENKLLLHLRSEVHKLENEPTHDSFKTEAAIRRGQIHQAIRAAFPLLVSTTSEDSIHVSVDTRFHSLITYLHDPCVDLPLLYEFFKAGYDASGWRKNMDDSTNCLQSTAKSPVLRLRSDLQRDQRRPVHRTIDEKSNRLLGTSTIPEYKLMNGDTCAGIVIHWTKTAHRKVTKKRKRELGETDGPQNILFVMKKRQREHLAAFQLIAKALGCRQSDMGYAGVKDFKAVTYQFCTVTGISPEKVFRSIRFLKAKSIDIGNVHVVDWHLQLGHLVGNRFEIILRNIQRVEVKKLCSGEIEECRVPVGKPHLLAMTDRLSKSGFINFYGEQRVGIPGDMSTVGVRAFDVGRAMMQRDYLKAVDLIMQGRRIVRDDEFESEDALRFRRTWIESKGDLDMAWKQLPKGPVLLREKAILKGLRRYGKDDPLAALKCLHLNERTMWINAYQSYLWNQMVSARLAQWGAKVVAGDLVMRSDGKVEIVLEPENELFADVVLPMVGSGILYPKNDIGILYQNCLVEDLIDFSKNSNNDDMAPRGTYRRILAFAQNISFQACTIDDEDNTCEGKLSFDLPKGCYATMFLREFMYTTVSRGCNQITRSQSKS